jgi:ATP-dependent helicase HrpA
VPLENRALPLNYAYKPGQADDGVTLDVNVREAEALTPAALDWAVPGHLEAKVEHYLRALPKELRRGFVPAGGDGEAAGGAGGAARPPDGAARIAARGPGGEIAERFRLALDPAVWADKPLPDHLRVRVRVLDDDGARAGASRDLAELRHVLVSQSARRAGGQRARSRRPGARRGRNGRRRRRRRGRSATVPERCS